MCLYNDKRQNDGIGKKELMLKAQRLKGTSKRKTTNKV